MLNLISIESIEYFGHTHIAFIIASNMLIIWACLPLIEFFYKDYLDKKRSE